VPRWFVLFLRRADRKSFTNVERDGGALQNRSVEAVPLDR
jgi:hypothetical protein